MHDDLCRYEKELLKTIHGFRLRKRVRQEFRRSIQVLLSDSPDPDYKDILAAFGPPATMAETLIHTIPDPPKPLDPRKKLGIAGILCLAIGIAFLAVYSLVEVPETNLTISDGSEYTSDFLAQSYTSLLVDTFSAKDVDWEQPREYGTYLLLLHNTNHVPTSVEVRYSKHQSPHTFKIPAGEQRALLVTDPRFTTHTIAFVAEDGTLSGTVSVFASESPT